MCGRYAFYLPPDELKKRLGLENLLNFPARYNCAPMQELPIVVRGRAGFARWGFCPPWKEKDDPGFAAKMINARSETVAEKPSFRESWHKARRCLVPASGFYEWKKDEASGFNQPYFIRDPQDNLICFAGLWSKIGDLVTFTILTKDAEGPVKDIHHRSPVIMAPAQAGEWFAADLTQAAALVRQSSSAHMKFTKVGKAVGNVANDTAELVEPLIAESQ